MTKPIPAPSHISSEEDFDRIASERQAHNVAGIDAPDGLAQRARCFSAAGVSPDWHPQHHTRLALVLNVGLDNNPFRDVPQQKRADLYAILIDRMLRNAQLRPLHNTALILQTVKPSEGEAFDALYFDAAAYRQGFMYLNVVQPIDPQQALWRIKLAILGFASLTEQDAIAWRFNDSGSRQHSYLGCGMTGLNNANWPDFDPARFTDVIAAGPTFAASFPRS